jgi:DnaJ family protein C protein 19
VTVLIVVLLAVLALAAFAEQKGAAARKGTTRGPAKKRVIHPYWLLGALVLGVVLLRFGVNWIVVAGGMLLAALRSLAPVLRFLPLLQGLLGGRSADEADASRRPPGPSPGNGSPPRRMTRQEALQVFGLDESATREDVQREYRRLMRKVHPDLGGSGYLAAKLNEAKDVLS